MESTSFIAEVNRLLRGNDEDDWYEFSDFHLSIYARSKDGCICFIIIQVPESKRGTGLFTLFLHAFEWEMAFSTCAKKLMFFHVIDTGLAKFLQKQGYILHNKDWIKERSAL